MSKKSANAVQTTETTFDIVDTLLERGKCGIDELTEELGLSDSTAYRHLSTLKDRGYVLNEGDSYELSLRFLTIGGYLQRQIPAYSIIKEKVDQLAEKTGERSQFIVREKDERVYLYTEFGEHHVQTGAHTGRRGPIYASAAGKSILAHLPDSRCESLLHEIDFERTGPNTIVDRDELQEELATIRERGYALNYEESTKGVHAIGTIVKANNEIIGALSVSGPATRLKADQLTSELPEDVRAASNELELHIEHSASNLGRIIS